MTVSPTQPHWRVLPLEETGTSKAFIEQSVSSFSFWPLTLLSGRTKTSPEWTSEAMAVPSHFFSLLQHQTLHSRYQRHSNHVDELWVARPAVPRMGLSRRQVRKSEFNTVLKMLGSFLGWGCIFRETIQGFTWGNFYSFIALEQGL